jgi:hypothetical protein
MFVKLTVFDQQINSLAAGNLEGRIAVGVAASKALERRKQDKA